MPTFIILGIIFQIFTYNKVAWCSTPKECIKSNVSNNVFQDDLYQKEIKLHTHDHIHHTLNFYPYTTNKLRVHAYNYRSPFSFTYKSKMQLQNDSINMFHSFYTQPSKHKKNLSFMQLGVHNFLSEQIFNFGGGKRHLTNDKYAIGYNTFYHCPISKKSSSQPYSINVGVEYWLYNTLFMLNNYYNLNNIFDPETSLQKCNIHYPKSGHQLYIQTKFPHFFEFTGKIKLEQFIYEKKYKKIFNKKNSDYYLSLDLNYQPIPMLGFGINNIFVNKQYNNTICRVLIDYQFGTPIMEQIHYTNKNKSILNNLDTIIQPFIPTIIPHHDYISINDHNHLPSLRDTHKITGYPGEIKIIKVNDNNDKYVRWDFESLENHGGNIVAITPNTYALYFPNYPIKQENNIFVSYITNNATQSHQEQKKQNIHIVVKNFSQKKLLNTNTQKKDMSIINVNNDSGINVTENTAEHTLICHDDDQCSSSIKNNTSVSNVFFAPHPQQDVCNTTPTENDQNTITKDNHIFLAPPPPPIPFPFLEKDSSASIASSTLNDTLLLNQSASTSHEDQQTHSEKNAADNEKMHDTFFKSSKIDFNQSDDLSYRLFTHRQSKFASLGTTEHINKLENTIRERKKTKHLSDMEQIFVKLNLAQSSSSISEDCATDDSSDSFNSTNKEEQYH